MVTFMLEVRSHHVEQHHQEILGGEAKYPVVPIFSLSCSKLDMLARFRSKSFINKSLELAIY